MKTKTPFDTTQFIPHADEVQYAGQISDHPMFPTKIGRILVVTKYFPDADAQRLSIFGYLIHIDLDTMEKVCTFKDTLEDWIVSNNYKVALRDANGMLIPNPDFIPEEDREEGVEYTENQLSQWQMLPAYIRFSRMIKTYAVPAQVLFQKIVDMDDMMNNVFDHYGNIREFLEGTSANIENPTFRQGK